MNKGKNDIIKKTIRGCLLTIIGYIIILYMYYLINNSPKTSGINYGAIIYIFMLIGSSFLILTSIPINVSMIYKNIRLIMNNDKSNIKHFVICLVVNTIVLLLNIAFFILFSSKILLNKEV